MALLVEIHVPLPAGAVDELAEEEHPIVWIEEIEDFLARLDMAGELEAVPAGAFAMVTDDEAEEFGMGRRVDLPVS